MRLTQVLHACCWLLLVTVLAGACDKTSSSCTKELGELKRWIDQLQAEGPSCAVHGFAPGTAQSIDRPPNGGDCDVPLIGLGAKQVTLDGMSVGASEELLRGDSRELAELLARKDKLAESFGKPPPKRVAVVAVPEVPWATVVAVVRQLAKAKRAQVTFLFETNSKLVAPSGTKRIDELRELSAPLDTSKPAPILSDAPGVGQRVLSRCEEANALLEPLSRESLTPAQKRPRVHAAMLKGLAKCDCTANMTDVRGILWAQMGRFKGPPYFGATLSLAQVGAADAKALSQPATSTWRDAHKQVLTAAESDQKIRFEAVP